MHGDFSRSTFSRRNGYRAVLLQQGRVVLDADFNEQADLTAHHDEARTQDIVGRTGGPLPADPTDPGPFAVLAADGTVPDPVGVPWVELMVTAGRYYVDGVLAEAFPPPPPASSSDPTGTGWRLIAQPFGSVSEPPADVGNRVAVYLEVTDHVVTADEAPALRESALGGPDTSVRRQTTWQVGWRPLEDEVCSDLDAAFFARTPRTMIAGLRLAPAAADPCRITASGGYQRLENQLYRVQIHDVAANGTSARFLWSRENGSVVAGALQLTGLPVAGMARIALDREGRDAELDIAIGNLVELTSPARQRHREPGYLATVRARTGLDLDVEWLDAVPATLADLGNAPIVRRWEGGPANLAATATDLEDGITVRFPAGGRPRVGDYWQIPARTVQLAYGLSAATGTIEWPPPGATGEAAPPFGPPSRCAPLGILQRTDGGDGDGAGSVWFREHDCRTLFPPLTGLVSLDLAGGDGQESLPGAWLDEPVRVVVRNGGRPVAGARVRCSASDGGELSIVDPPVAGPADPVVETGADGVASVRWRLNDAGPVTQVLSAQRIDDHDAETDVQIRATARLSVASEIAYAREGCEVFAGVETVHEALDGLATHPELRLQGGDGQEVPPGRLVVPQPIRVIVDSACGPVGRAAVVATGADGAHARPAKEGEPVPDELWNDPREATAETAADGAALFWWQPRKPTGPADSDTLQVRLREEERRSPIVVGAQWELAGGGGAESPGAHVVDLVLGTGKKFPNDADFQPEEFASGVVVRLDQDVPDEMSGKPVLWVELDLPWPMERERSPWGSFPVGTRTMKPAGDVRAGGPELHWVPRAETIDWMSSAGGLWWFRDELKLERGILGRVVLEGWAVRTAAEQAVNTHTETVLDQGRLLHRFPSDDLVAGGNLVQWFYLHPGDVDRLTMPSFTGMVNRAAMERARSLGLQNVVFDPPSNRTGIVVGQSPIPGTSVTLTTPVVLSVGIPQ